MYIIQNHLLMSQPLVHANIINNELAVTINTAIWLLVVTNKYIWYVHFTKGDQQNHGTSTTQLLANSADTIIVHCIY